MASHDDDTPGRILGRRDVLRALGRTTLALTVLPGALSRLRAIGPATAYAADAACVVRPALTEGPYFVDELLNRSDIRADPSTGVVSAGTVLTLGFAVSRIDGGVCAPFEGAMVDVWHCDAAGRYSDESANGTLGKRFLRGYQVTDAAGTARFVTIYPGWYEGRTVHIHFKVRHADTAVEFTSQLFFDDALTDAVYAVSPYAARGTRSTRNADDDIYAAGGAQLQLAVASDGAGGWAATFALAIDMTGTSGGTTTTTLAGGDGACDTVASCLGSLGDVLPDASSASSRTARRVAVTLARILAQATRAATHAATRTGAARRRGQARVRRLLQRLLTVATSADAAGTLDASLASITAAVEAVLALLPA